MRTLARIPRAVLLAVAVASLAACSRSTSSQNLAPGEGPPGATPSEAIPGPSAEGPATAPPSSTSSDSRERQFEILNEAVNALRQEASRSNVRMNDLSRDTERLRGLIASLQRRIAKSRDQSRELLDHVHDLEKRLQEIDTPAPERPDSAKPSEPPPVAQAPPSPGPAPEEASPFPGGGDGSAHTPDEPAPAPR